jgi:hypothetical protein
MADDEGEIVAEGTKTEGWGDRVAGAVAAAGVKFTTLTEESSDLGWKGLEKKS